MPLLPADFTHAKDCKLNLRKNVDTTLLFGSLHSPELPWIRSRKEARRLVDFG